MERVAELIHQLIDQQEGVLKCRPTYVARFYRDGGRMGTGRGRVHAHGGKRGWTPERWIVSGTATNPSARSRGEGLTRLVPADRSRTRGPTLREAFGFCGPRLLGHKRFQTHGPEFRVLIKILDSRSPIPFHFHASDEAVARHPKRFAPDRFGKDEAYFFLDGPKGPCPYTHVGLGTGVNKRTLQKALAQGPQKALELSPAFYQKAGEGFFVPAGLVHRPGTALTLEIQQPSDVYTLLEDTVEGHSLASAQKHPGFTRMEDALAFIDFKTCCQKDLFERYRLVPRPVTGNAARGVLEEWIFPPGVCGKFGGKRLRVTRRATTLEPECYGVLIWKGTGRFGRHSVKSGDEFFVSYEAARRGVTLASENGDLELFKFFAAPV